MAGIGGSMALLVFVRAVAVKKKNVQ